MDYELPVHVQRTIRAYVRTTRVWTTNDPCMDYGSSVHISERSVYATPLTPGYVIVNPEWYTVVSVMCNWNLFMRNR